MNIAFDGGPLDGQILRVPNDARKYEVKILAHGSGQHGDSAEPIKTTLVVYRRTERKHKDVNAVIFTVESGSTKP